MWGSHNALPRAVFYVLKGDQRSVLSSWSLGLGARSQDLGARALNPKP